MTEVNVSFIMKMSKRNSQRKCPVVCRITAAGEVREISLGMTVDPDEWDHNRRRVKAKHPESGTLNSGITHLEATLNHIAADLRLKGELFSAADLKRLCKNSTRSS